jgi:hypothetical protein
MMALEALAELPPGAVMLYGELESLLGLDRMGMQAVVNQAKSSLQKTHKRSVVAVRNVGYRVLAAAEHLDLAKVHQRKGRRQTRRSKSAVVNTDYNELSESERLRFDIAVDTIRALQAFERRADLRYASRERVESFIAHQSAKNERTESEVLDMQERLARLEAKLAVA